jgi:hypothetical protein
MPNWPPEWEDILRANVKPEVGHPKIPTYPMTFRPYRDTNFQVNPEDQRTVAELGASLTIPFDDYPLRYNNEV